MGLEHEEHTGSCKGLDMGLDDRGTNLFVPSPRDCSISTLESMIEEKNTFLGISHLLCGLIHLEEA